MTNHLANSTSPYLLQHAENPVDWYPWGPEALQKARAENKPIFLSIGYAACHWCHVMAHESFQDPETARLLNEHFVSIKVDREERPDLDSIYMAATQALTGSGGWPMSVFLTSDLKPFYAGTYFPPVRRYNMPSFGEILASLDQAWREQPEEVARVSSQVLDHIQPAKLAGKADAALNQADLDGATAALLDSYDWGYGGWGGPPKFPQPMLIEFLLRRAASGAAAGEQSLKAAEHALKAMARGGMYDVIGGGFARYSTDNFWHVPHFEKMLYDNAQLARAYLHAWQITRDPTYKAIVVATLDFVKRELTGPEGGFYSSLDADSEGEEGKFYAWTSEQIRAALKDEAEFDLFAAAYGITDKGNWEGANVLQRALDDATLAARFKRQPDQVARGLGESHRKLLDVRSARPRPATDDKVLAGWSGLMLRAFAEAARFLDDPEKAGEYLRVATRSAGFMLAELRPDNLLRRSWRLGKVGHAAFLEDYAACICGLLDLYQADFNNAWFAAAESLADEVVERFADPAGGFFDSATDAEPLLVRPKDLQDNATPSGSALATEALLKLAALTDRGDLRDVAELALSRAAEAVRRFPAAFGHWLNAADFALSPVTQIAVVFKDATEEKQDLLKVVNRQYRPNSVLAASLQPAPKDAPALLAERTLKQGKNTAYVCERFVCRQPVNTPEELSRQL
jgi:uncharacterized protein